MEKYIFEAEFIAELIVANFCQINHIFSKVIYIIFILYSNPIAHFFLLFFPLLMSWRKCINAYAIHVVNNIYVILYNFLTYMREWMNIRQLCKKLHRSERGFKVCDLNKMRNKRLWIKTFFIEIAELKIVISNSYFLLIMYKVNVM